MSVVPTLRPLTFALLTCLWTLAIVVASAQAADVPSRTPVAPDTPAPLRPVFVRFGVTGAFFDQGLGEASIAGQPIIGGGLKTDPVVSAYAEAGYFLTRQLAVSISGGWPPRLTEKGTGVLAPFGTLARGRVGAATTTAHYHFDYGRLHPYLGGGLAYAIVFHNAPGAIAQPVLRDGLGGVVVGGVDFDLDDRWSAFLDIKNAWVAQRMSGLAAPVPGGPAILPLKTRLHSDLVLVTGGLGYRF